jgi:WD40 repeat protein
MDRSIKFLTGHHDIPHAICELQDGRIASVGREGIVMIWNLKGELEHSFQAHTKPTVTLIQLKDGFLATGSNDNTIGFWKVDGTPVATFRGHTDSVRSLCQMRDGRILSGSMDKSLKIWNLQGEVESTLLGHTKPVFFVTQLGDGEYISGSNDKTFRIWNDRECLLKVDAHDKGIQSIVCLPGNRFATASFDGSIKIWWYKDKISLENTLLGHKGGVWSLCVLPDDRLASGSDDGSVNIWSQRGECLDTIPLNQGVTFLITTTAGHICCALLDNTIAIIN